jgi:hypothetical protein
MAHTYPTPIKSIVKGITYFALIQDIWAEAVSNQSRIYTRWSLRLRAQYTSNMPILHSAPVSAILDQIVAGRSGNPTPPLKPNV